MDWNNKTVETYDESAEALAAYFAGVGSRVDDVERGISLTNQDPQTIRAVEIGCGDGRDAAEITNRVGWYEGFDPSNGLLTLARQKLPHAHFVTADALHYNYPANIDLYFAFASLLHVNREDLSTAFKKVESSLRPGGIFYISLKERASYQEEVKEDQFGKRMFYYYNPTLVEGIAGVGFKKVFEDHQTIGKTDWFTLALKKQ